MEAPNDSKNSNEKDTNEETGFLAKAYQEAKSEIENRTEEEDDIHFSYRPYKISVQGDEEFKIDGVYVKFKDEEISMKGRGGFLLSNKNISIKYESIENFEINSTLFSKLVIHIRGRTYKASKCAVEDAQELHEFVDEKIYEAKQRSRSQSSNKKSDNHDPEEQDSIEQIKKLKELQEDGIITEDEFQEKKRDLLNKI